MAQALVEARCAHHPEQRADAGTCERCGSYMCASCFAPDSPTVLCVSCYDRLYGDSRMVGHVRVFSIVLAVHAGLLALFGLFAGVFGGSLGASFGAMGAPTGRDAEVTRLTENTLVVAFVLLGLLHVAVAALQAVAAYRIWRYRSRGLAVAALVVGLVLVLGCYCAPSAVVVLVWGLVVLFHPAVAARFRSAARQAT